tara:strand:- start:746 stop:1492 length:747 start_codon:yes stop_codon:yes gene_type:complete
MNKNKGFNNINNGFYTANENNSNSLVGQLTNRLSIREVVNILKRIKVKNLSDNQLNELAEKLKKELELAYPRGKPSPLRFRERFKLREINQHRSNIRNTQTAVKKEKKFRNKIRNEKMLNEFIKNPKYNSKNLLKKANRDAAEVAEFLKKQKFKKRAERQKAAKLKKKLENAERSRIEGLVKSLPVSNEMSKVADTDFPKVPTRNFKGGRKKTKTKRKTTKKKTRKPKVHTGPRGGKYIMRKGKKVYV